METRFRSDYVGEFVITETKWSGGKKTQTREWVPNPIENHHISGRAACIGSSIDKDFFDYTRLERHRGGLLGSKKLQTYGVGEIAQEMRLDFTVETNANNINEIVDKKYHDANIVYTNVRNCLAHPGEFYLIPYSPLLPTTASIVYLAAFDEHKEIFLLGYRPEILAGVQRVFAAYPYTTFYLVGHVHRNADECLNYANVKQMDVRDFISYCDV